MTLRSRTRSQAILRQAEQVLVGGVNSPVRAFRAVGGEPLIIERARGARVVDADGNEYIDYVCAYGPLILGHADPVVYSALVGAAARGTAYGATTELEIEQIGRASCRERV